MWHGVFIDFKKTFDTVNHSAKEALYHYGRKGIVHDWLASYLSDRFQTTEIGDYISNNENCLLGVPQESVLGSLLFLLYVNNISSSSTKFNFYLFADDTSILYSDKNIHKLEQIVNSELKNVSR